MHRRVWKELCGKQVWQFFLWLGALGQLRSPITHTMCSRCADSKATQDSLGVNLCWLIYAFSSSATENLWLCAVWIFRLWFQETETMPCFRICSQTPHTTSLWRPSTPRGLEDPSTGTDVQVIKTSLSFLANADFQKCWLSCDITQFPAAVTGFLHIWPHSWADSSKQQAFSNS